MSLKLFSEQFKYNDFEDKTTYYVVEQFGYKNELGEVVIKPEYTKAYEFSDGLALVYSLDEYKFINEKGDIVILLGKDVSAGSFLNGLATVCSNETFKYALISREGKQLTDFIFEKEEDAQIDDLETMVKLVEKEGVKVLNWASAMLFVNDDSFNLLKNALKEHLQSLVPKIDMSKISGEEEFRALIQQEYDNLMEIRRIKIEHLEKENRDNLNYFSSVDNLVK